MGGAPGLPSHLLRVSGGDRQGDVHHQAGGGASSGRPRPADGVRHHPGRIRVRGDQVSRCEPIRDWAWRRAVSV